MLPTFLPNSYQKAAGTEPCGVPELAAHAGVELRDIVALEKPEWPSPSAAVIESIARALDVDPLPLLELGGFSRTENKVLGELAVEFAARLEAMKPLEPQEQEALCWLRNHGFKSRPKRAELAESHQFRLLPAEVSDRYCSTAHAGPAPP